MKRLVAHLVAIIVIALAVRMVCVSYAPRIIMAIVLRRTAARAGSVNRPYHAPPITDASRDVVLPSPDLRYSACSLDLSRGPVEISAIAPRSYFSLAIFDDNTDNVFVFNDRDARQRPLKLRVHGPLDPITPPARDAIARADATPVQVPSERALVLLRALAVDPRMTVEAEAARHTLQCRPLRR